MGVAFFRRGWFAALPPGKGVEMNDMLFDKGEPPPAAEIAAQRAGWPRLRVSRRDQVEMRWRSLDELLEPDHQARVVWAAVAGLDLGNWLRGIKAVEGAVGRRATDPRLLVALWACATLDGVGSARELDRLCGKHLAHQWLCGGVGVNYHLLADFRSREAEAWDELLTQIVAALLSEDLVRMTRVAQDGMRGRASAGKSSFRRKETLESHLEDARRQVEALRALGEEESRGAAAAARRRAADERQTRIEEALRHCEQLRGQKEAREKNRKKKTAEARASTTDAEARVMQFSDGGFRPGRNVQFSTDTETGVIVGVDATGAGSDQEQLPPMLEQLRNRYGFAPDEALVDGGFAALAAIEAADALGCTVYAPLKNEKKQRAAGKDPHAKKPGDGPAAAAWRKRMGEAAAKAVYRLRGQTAEWVNAGCRNRGLRQMPVRGQVKCRSVALLHAITHNLLQAVKLRARAAAA